MWADIFSEASRLPTARSLRSSLIVVPLFLVFLYMFLYVGFVWILTEYLFDICNPLYYMFLIVIVTTISEKILLIMSFNNSFAPKVDMSGMPEKFSGQNFKRWQQRMKIWLTAIGLVDVIEKAFPISETEDPNIKAAQELWIEKDRLCRGCILLALSNVLFDVYSSSSSASVTAKDLWDELDKKYNTEDVGHEKYYVGKFLKFQMVESKSVTEQAHQFMILIHGLKEADMKLPEKFLVMSIIEKFPRSWEDFGMSLKHRRGKLTMDDLMVAIAIEEEHRGEKPVMPVEFQPKANVLIGSSSKTHVKGKPQPINKIKPKAKIQKKPTNKPCWNCGQVGHWAKDCPSKKAKRQQGTTESTPQVNVLTEVDEMDSKFVSVNPQVFSIYEPREWLVDTGANVHVCADKSMFVSYQPVDRRSVAMANGNVAKVLGIGRIDLKLPSGRVLSLHRTHHVPAVRRNIISGPCLVVEGYEVTFKCNKVVITLSGTFIGKGYLSCGAFLIHVEPTFYNRNAISVKNVSAPVVYSIESGDVWHKRLGHVNYQCLKRMMNLNMIPKYAIENKKCQVCVQAKQPKRPFHSVTRNTSILDLVHTDTCEFNGMLTKDKKKYFITFIDDSSKYCYVYLLKSKDEALSKFLIFKNEAETQTEKKLKRLRSDRGGEYTSNLFEQVCQDSGIVHEVTAPYSPQSNGIAERKNRTLSDMINALLESSGLPKYMWGEALNTACHILNKVPQKHKEDSPFELWCGRKPSLKYLKVWGCLAKVLIPEHKRKKLGPKTVDAIFIGYVINSYAYRFLVIKSEISGIDVNTIVEFRDATFFEDVFPMKSGVPQQVSSSVDPSTSGSIHEHVERMTNVGADLSITDFESSQTQVEIEPRKSKRSRIAKDLGSDFITYHIEGDPNTFKDAMASSEAKHWKDAVKVEMDSIVSNGTWELVNLPPGCSTIGCKWIFKRKLKPDGSIDKYKARLVAKGFKQKEGIDYFDTYSPVSRMTTIRVLLALASVYDFTIHQMDVKTAFLHGDLEEEIYMDQPEGFVASGNENKVCKLVKSLYGLKQAPKAWHEKFDKIILSFGFQVIDSDKCVYCKVQSNACIALCLYVDDILLFGSNLNIIHETKSFLCTKFEMKDMGVANVILGIKLTRSVDGISISQSHYVEKILERFGYTNCRSVKTPYDSSKPLYKNKSGVPVSQLRYSQIIGSLMYLANCTRPDISFSVSKLSRYTSCPDRTHWEALDRVLKYLKGTSTLGLHYGKFPAVLEGYSDASWIAKNSGSNGVTGYVFTLGGGAVSWRSTKQTILSRSTFEAELCALDTSGMEAEWLKGLLSELPMTSKPVPAISVHCDSMTTIAKLKSSKYNHKQRRHIQVRLKSVRELISERVIAVDFVGTKDNTADPFTKGLDLAQVLKSKLGMGLRPIT